VTLEARLARLAAQGLVTLPTLKGGRIEIVPLRAVPQREGLREYRQDEIRRFLKEDRLDPGTAAKVRRLRGRKRPA